MGASRLSLDWDTIRCQVDLEELVGAILPALEPGLVAASALVEPGAVLGGATRVWRMTHVRQGAVVGANATVICGSHIGPYAMIASLRW